MEYRNTDFLRDYLRILGPYKGAFLVWYTVRFLTSASMLFPAFAMAQIIDFFTRYEGGSLEEFYFWLIAIFVVIVISSLIRLVTKYQLGNISRDARQSVRISAFSSLLSHDLAWHEEESAGAKLQKINTGARGIDSFSRFLSQDSTEIIIGLAGVAIVFAPLGIKYSLIVIAFIAIYLSWEFWMNSKVARRQKELTLFKEQLSGKITEYTSNISTVKSLGMGKHVEQDASGLEQHHSDLERQAHLLGTFKWIGINLIIALAFGMFLFVMGTDIVAGAITVGSIALFMEYLRRTQAALNTISTQADKVIEAKYSIQRIMPYLQHRRTDKGRSRFPRWQRITFTNIVFRYKDKQVLSDATFTIYRGEKIGIVGASGEGKTTIFKLLLKLYEPASGAILVENLRLQDIKEEEIFSHVTIVPQEVELFNSSLQENIAITNDVDRQRLIRALHVADCEALVKKLSNGAQTIVGERGVRLSGGERQRIGIARAVYADAEIILMDESTSHLDSATERRIQENLHRELKEKTVIAIAHRLSTLSSFDRILVLKEGRVVEDGSYQELLKKKGEFYKLHRMQK